jgi:hypothetical protein
MGAKIALSECYSMARSEGNILKSAPIFAKRDLVFCAAI